MTDKKTGSVKFIAHDYAMAATTFIGLTVLFGPVVYPGVVLGAGLWLFFAVITGQYDGTEE